jgi:hypothetical protein
MTDTMMAELARWLLAASRYGAAADSGPAALAYVPQYWIAADSGSSNPTNDGDVA